MGFLKSYIFDWLCLRKFFFFLVCFVVYLISFFNACPQTANTHSLLSILHVLLLQVSSTAFPFFYFILWIISVVAIYVYFLYYWSCFPIFFFSPFRKKTGRTSWYLAYQQPSGWHGPCQGIYPTPHSDRCFTVSTQCFLHLFFMNPNNSFINAHIRPFAHTECGPLITCPHIRSPPKPLHSELSDVLNISDTGVIGF